MPTSIEPNLRMLFGRIYYRRKNWHLRVFRDRTHEASSPHIHDFIEIFIVLGGSGWHYSTQGKQRLEVGDTFAIRPGAWHYFHLCHDLEIYNCLIGVDLFQRTLSSCGREAGLHYLWWDGPLSLDRRGMMALKLKPAAIETCIKHLDEIERLDKTLETMASAAQIAYFLLFLVELSSELGDDYRAPLELSSNASLCVERCIALMEGKLAYAWSIDELCQSLHISRFYLMHIFKHRTGSSPMTYLARRRAERAAQLLMRSDIPINEVASQVGWDDPNYFARRFKEHFGISATQYRKQLKEGGT